MDERRIVVIGAGVVGAALTHRLTEAGARVTLLDRDAPGRGSSRWSLAWLNSNGKTPRAYHDLTVSAMRGWAELAARAEGAAWYRPVGNLRWAGDDLSHRQLAERVALLGSWGYRAEWLDQAEVARLEPALTPPPNTVGTRTDTDTDTSHTGTSTAWFPDEGYVLTERLVEVLLRRAASAGAEVRTGAAGEVVALRPEGHGRHTVTTADSSAVQADVLVCCVGRWTPDVGALTGERARVPLVPWRTRHSTSPGLAVRAGPVAVPPQRVLHTPRVHLRAHGRDQVHLEADDATVDSHTPGGELDGWAETLLHRARRVIRGLEDARVVHRTVCVRPMPLDGLPVVGPTGAEGHGPYVVVTHSGVTLAAGLAELVTRELLGGEPQSPLSTFRPGRFADYAG